MFTSISSKIGSAKIWPLSLSISSKIGSAKIWPLLLGIMASIIIPPLHAEKYDDNVVYEGSKYSLFLDADIVENNENVEFINETVINEIDSREGLRIANKLKARRKKSINFSMPELRDVLNNMQRNLKAIKLLEACHDKKVVNKMIDELSRDRESGYPYRKTIMDIFKANLLVDFIYSKEHKISYTMFTNNNYPHLKCGIQLHALANVESKNIYYITYAQAYPLDYTENTIYSMDFLKQHRRNNDFEEFFPLMFAGDEYPTPEALLRLIDRDDIILLPTFEQLSIDFFLETAPLKIFPLGLAQGYVAYADSLYFSTAQFFNHDIRHTEQILKHDKPDLSCSQEFPTTCTETGKCFNGLEVRDLVIDTLYRTVKYADWLSLSDKTALTNHLSWMFFQLMHEKPETGCSPVALAFLTSEDGQKAIQRDQVNFLIPNSEFDATYHQRAIAWVEQVGTHLREKQFQNIYQADLCQIYKGIEKQFPFFWQKQEDTETSLAPCSSY